MAITLIGRKTMATATDIRNVAQDPDNKDLFYFTSGKKIYKFEWDGATPSNETELYDAATDIPNGEIRPGVSGIVSASAATGDKHYGLFYWDANPPTECPGILDYNITDDNATINYAVGGLANMAWYTGIIVTGNSVFGINAMASGANNHRLYYKYHGTGGTSMASINSTDGYISAWPCFSLSNSRPAGSYLKNQGAGYSRRVNVDALTFGDLEANDPPIVLGAGYDNLNWSNVLPNDKAPYVNFPVNHINDDTYAYAWKQTVYSGTRMLVLVRIKVDDITSSWYPVVNTTAAGDGGSYRCMTGAGQLLGNGKYKVWFSHYDTEGNNRGGLSSYTWGDAANSLTDYVQVDGGSSCEVEAIFLNPPYVYVAHVGGTNGVAFSKYGDSQIVTGSLYHILSS